MSNMVLTRSYSYIKLCRAISNIYGIDRLVDIQHFYDTYGFEEYYKKLKWSNQDDLDYLEEKMLDFECKIKYGKAVK